MWCIHIYVFVCIAFVQEWRKTTWAGWFVTKLLELGNHIRPFIRAVTEAMRDDQNKGTRALSIVLRLLVVVVLLVAALTFGRIIQSVIGKEIFIEQEVVVVEEVPRSRAQKEGIVEGEQELTIAQARERLGKEALAEAMQEVNKEEKGKRRGARDKKNQ